MKRRRKKWRPTVDENFTDPFYALGRIQGVVEMLDKPEIYRMTNDQAIERIREIMARYKLNREADRG